MRKAGVCIPVRQWGRCTVGKIAVLDNSSDGVGVVPEEGSYKMVIVL